MYRDKRLIIMNDSQIGKNLTCHIYYQITDYKQSLNMRQHDI